jgi:hypothetical protein
MRQYLTIRDFINLFPAGRPVHPDSTDHRPIDLGAIGHALGHTLSGWAP